MLVSWYHPAIELSEPAAVSMRWILVYPIAGVIQRGISSVHQQSIPLIMDAIDWINKPLLFRQCSEVPNTYHDDDRSPNREVSAMIRGGV